MNQITMDFIQTIQSQIDELESATSRLVDNAPDSAGTDTALHAARNAFATLEGFLETTAANRSTKKVRS